MGGELGLAEFGSSDGTPLLYFHGHPGSRLEAGFLADAAARHQVRLIGIDRPGMGLSTYQPHRRILDWPQDVAALADHLRIKRFAVVGFSAGAPYALACAYAIPERLLACGVVSGAGQPQPLQAFLASWLPWVVLPVARRRFASKEKARRALRRLAAKWPAPDRGALDDDAVLDLMAGSLVEAFSQGSRGVARDGSLLGAEWGFEPQQVRHPMVRFWHGRLDTQVKPEAALLLANRVQGSQLSVLETQGHISSIAKHGDEIVQALVRR